MRVAAGLGLVSAWFARFSLRANLAILLVAVVAILIVDRVRDQARLQRDEIARTQVEITERARAAAKRQSDVIAEARALLHLAVENPVTAPGSGSACRDTFKRIKGELPWLTSIAVFDIDGFPACSSDDQVATANFADRAYFREALATGNFALSDYMIGRITGKPVIVLALPRMHDGVAEAVVIVGIDLAWMSRIAAETGSMSGAQVLLVDKNATVLAAYPEPKAWDRSNLERQPALRSALMAGDAGEPININGEMHLVGQARLADTGAIIAVMLPLDRILAAANRHAWIEIGSVLGAGLLALVVIWFGGALLVVRPIQSLAWGATLLGSGELTARIPTEGLAPELRRLGESFNAMASRLREREAELHRANERLADLASKDGLTGIANRRGFDEQFAVEWNRTKRSAGSIALIVLDVDHFKKFNDRYGHLAGDACLQRVAACLGRIARRAGDFAARTGGEEFALLLPGTDLSVAAAIGEAVRLEIEALNIAHESSPEGRVTVSVGVAACRAVSDDKESLVDLADSALYRAKRAGRNRVVDDRTGIALAS
jgi:diguanylate cyclase (GGDEF)-like protein